MYNFKMQTNTAKVKKTKTNVMFHQQFYNHKKITVSKTHDAPSTFTTSPNTSSETHAAF